MRRRIILLLTVAAMMAMLLVGSAAPAFALPEHFLSNEKGPSPEALHGLENAVDTTANTPPPSMGEIVIVKVKDKATPIILE